MKQSDMPQAKCGTVVVCLFVIIAGQGWLLRRVLAGGVSAWPAAIWGELAFCVVMLAALLWCWFKPRGWTNNLGCGIAFGVFAAYLVFTIVCYDSFAQMYLTGIDDGLPSLGKALVAIKLVLAILAVVAGIPARPAPEGREYAEKLRQAAYRQEAEWAKGNIKGAKADFDTAMEKLKKSLSQEEIDALLAQLRAEAAEETGEDSPAEAPEQSPVEDLHGWGGGV